MRILLLLLLFFCALCVSGKNPAVSKALDGLKKVKKLLKDSGIKDKLDKVGQFGKIAAGAGQFLIHFIRFINTFKSGAGESKELKYMTEQFAIVNERLDALDKEFDSVKNLIDWTVLKVDMMAYEGDIKSLNEKLTMYVKAPLNAKRAFQEIFMSSYHYNFNDAPRKIYIMLTSTGVFQENFFKIARSHLAEDRRRVAQVTAYVMKLIQKGVVVKMAYLAMSKYNYTIPTVKKRWEENFAKIKSILVKTDQEIKAAWATQFKTDVDKYAGARGIHLSNHDLSRDIYNQLSAKYPWRRWFVLVHTYTKDNEKDRFFKFCHGGHKKSVGNKRVVYVHSYPDSKKGPRTNLAALFNRIPLTTREWSAKVKAARKLFGLVHGNCNVYSFLASIESKADVRINSIHGRFALKKVNVRRAWHSRLKPYWMVAFD